MSLDHVNKYCMSCIYLMMLSMLMVLVGGQKGGVSLQQDTSFYENLPGLLESIVHDMVAADGEHPEQEDGDEERAEVIMKFHRIGHVVS